jgi:thiamine-phosphate pyrophosphorylase
MNRRESPAPRLVLYSPRFDEDRARALIAEACEAADIASVILRTAGKDDTEILSRAKTLFAIAAEDGAVILLEDRPDLAAKARMDGVHFSNFPAEAAAFSSLKPHFIAGVAGLASRHEAMTAGEAGADYVMFGEPHGERRPSLDAIVERVSWWAEIFQIPCVAFAASLDEIPILVRAGADFIALDDVIWNSAAPIDTLDEAMARLQLERAE